MLCFSFQSLISSSSLYYSGRSECTCFDVYHTLADSCEIIYKCFTCSALCRKALHAWDLSRSWHINQHWALCEYFSEKETKSSKRKCFHVFYVPHYFTRVKISRKWTKALGQITFLNATHSTNSDNLSLYRVLTKIPGQQGNRVLWVSQHQF